MLTQHYLARQISVPAFAARLNWLRTNDLNVRALWHLIGDERIFEWAHSVGITTDETLRSLVPPLPPLSLRRIAGGAPEAMYLLTGLQDAELFLTAFAPHALPGKIRALDFGCGSGRILRFFRALANYEVTGCDIHPDLVKWCADNMSGGDTVAAGVMPPLPFVDSHFDLVYAKSVFSHLSRQSSDAWIGELARVTKPGGIALITVMGYATIDMLVRLEDRRKVFGLSLDEVTYLQTNLENDLFWQKQLDADSIERVQAGEDYGNAFIHPKFIETRWDAFDLVKILPGHMSGFQDLAILKRKAP
ncbi:class I SAM-dependent methyltransferase [Mycolicibacter sp. MYC123]|uniref:Class I SAM-dependent methyltransferase n=1 Tax=[Mycobacterium] zoologicum TaxID=2872311 RepID=A0ABU5YHF6_9MYCO|nr:class I SAM-dependent methyltransferase [Mycolicibacter sp. MYC123]MEB3049491.1 class I SAM-dependent methyltransferase [Mycolicibacter sp. MYC123]